MRKLCPDLYVNNIVDLDSATLLAAGIRVLLLDLDNTLTPWRSYEVPEEIVEWLTKTQEAGIKMCLVSNTRNSGRLRELSERFGIPFVRARMKPSRRGFVDALEILGAKPEETAMVGDQLLTDIWGGNRAGIRTIWIAPLHPKEFFGTKISRLLERLILWVFRMTGARSRSE